MKKIAFLIIATLMVLGLVLPGCMGPAAFSAWVDIAVAGPMAFIQGRDHWAGAVMARDEINADPNGIMIGGVAHGVRLTKVDTNEILDLTGADGTTALSAVIGSVDFVVGGFRTEAVGVYRDVAMNAHKIFIDCGAASNELQQSVTDNYTVYKYWFKGTPYNSTFLFTNMMKQLNSVNAKLRAAAGMGGGDPGTTVGVIVEDATWTGAFSTALPYYLPMYGFNVTGSVQKPSSTQTDLSTELTAIKNACPPDGPMMVVTVISGPPGKAYGMQQATYLPYSFTTGINVEAQDIDYHNDTQAQYHVIMDTWAEGAENTAKTAAFWTEYLSETGRYPSYTAATYDVILALKEACEDENSKNSDTLIPWFEDINNAQTGTASTTAYINDVYPIGGGYSVLNCSQALQFYPHLPALYGTDAAGVCSNWLTGAQYATCSTSTSLYGFLNAHGFLRHDTVYGPGWQTGLGAQWQPVDPAHPELTWHKVAWWPYIAVPGVGNNTPAKDLSPSDLATLKAVGLVDKYGNWNIEYPGTVAMVVPTSWSTHWHV